MIRSWRNFSIREKSTFLILVAILLPTLLLFVGQYYALSELRVTSRSSFENSLRQHFVEIEEKTQLRLIEHAEIALGDFPDFGSASWNSEHLQKNFSRVLENNPGADSVFAFQNINKRFSIAATSREKSFHQAKSVENPGDAIQSMGDENFVIPLISALQSPNRGTSIASYIIGQGKCEKCTAPNQSQSELIFLYRIFSSPGDFSGVRAAGVKINKDFLVNDLLSPVINEVAAARAAETGSQVVFGIFNERQQLIFTNDENSKGLEDFEVKGPFGRGVPMWTLAARFRDGRIDDLSDRYYWGGLLLMSLILGLLAVGIRLLLLVVGREVALAKAKSAFVSNVSHELKTPLSLIRLFAETLQGGRVTNPEKIQEYYRIISTETVRLTHLINNIMDFSAIEAGRKEYNFAPCDLSEVVSDVVQNYTYSLENSGFKVESNFADNLPLLLIDCDAIKQAVINLLNNASKYSTADKFIAVNVEQRNGNIAIEITDNGIGIAPNEQEKIFNDFYRVGGSNDIHNVKGSGLGLALVRHIAQAHGGRVTVNSVLHRGSTFTILLPIKNGAAN